MLTLVDVAKAFILIFFGCIYALGDDVLKERFLKEYPLESKLIANRLALVKGNIFAETRDKKQKIEYDFHVDHGKEKVHFVKTGVSRGVSIRLESVECYGDGQFFTLERHDPGKPFSLKGIGGSEREIPFYENYSGRFITVPLGIRPILLFKLMDTKAFELLDVSAAEPASGQIWVTFLYGATLPKRKCRVLLNPANHWSVIKQEIFDKESDKVELSMSVEYGEPLEGIRMPKSVQLMRDGQMDNPYYYSNWKLIGTPEAEFNLKYYDLPDVFAIRARNRWSSMLWFIGVIVCFGVCLIIYLRYRRVLKSRNESKFESGNT